jgi:RNA recognition motif-containing protein
MLQAGPVGSSRTTSAPRHRFTNTSVNVHLPKDRISMAHQGYGFCEFLTEEDAEYACKIMNQIKLWGKPIRVNKVCCSTLLIATRSNTLGINAASHAMSMSLLTDRICLFYCRRLLIRNSSMSAPTCLSAIWTRMSMKGCCMTPLVPSA